MFIEVADYSKSEKIFQRNNVLVVKIESDKIEWALFGDRTVENVKTTVTEETALQIFEDQNVTHLQCSDGRLLTFYGKKQFTFQDTMGLDEVVDYSIIDMYSTDDMPIPWISRFANTKAEKVLYSSRYRNINVHNHLLSVYMPFNTGNFDDCTIHLVNEYKLICNKEFDYVFDGEAFPVGKGGAMWQEHFFSAEVEVISQDEDGVEGEIKLVWNKDGSPCERETDIYLESDSGYIPKRKIRTDKTGSVKFKMQFLGLEKGDPIKLKVSTKHFSSIGQLITEV